MDPLIVDALAVFRLTRLITEDVFPPVARVRNAIWRRYPPVGQMLPHDEWAIADGGQHAFRWSVVAGLSVRTEVAVMPHPSGAMVTEPHPIGELIGCPWCVSPYVAIAVLAARRYAPNLWGPVAKVLAASAVAGVVASQV